MNLVFNAESLRPPITGIGNYSYHLLQALMQRRPDIQVHSFTGTGWVDGPGQLAITEAMKADGGQLPGGAKARIEADLRALVAKIPGTKAAYDALMLRRFKQQVQSLGDPVYHEPNYILKPFAGPTVTTVHDLSHIHYPHFHQPHVRDWLAELPETLARASAVITVSDVVRDEVMEHFEVPAERIHTVYEGVDAQYYPRTATECDEVLSAYDLAYGHYVLMVATLEPRKGVDTLLNAWEALPASLRADCPLILVGSSGWLNDDLTRQIERLESGGTVRRLGYVPSAHLPPLFAGASVFSYPSLYEGFGLPVLDAMASGVPVICRAGTSMAEFADGACRLCETGDAGELAAALEELLDNAGLRREWGERGRIQAQQFTWQRCAEQTAMIYDQIR